MAVLSLALGIGANTAIFTLINTVMLQSLPVRDPGRLVLFYDGISTGTYSGSNNLIGNEFSYPFWQYLAANNDSFESLAAFRQSNDDAVMHVAGANDSGVNKSAKVHLVSGNYFDVLGVNAALGRVLTPSDDLLTAKPAAVLSYPFWHDRFHHDSAILGKTVVLNGTAFTIIGVAAQEFFGERVQNAPDFLLPLHFQPEILKRESWLTATDTYWLNCIGRLKPGTTIASAQALVTARLRQYYLDQAGSHPSSATVRKIHDVNVELKPGGGGISGLRFLYSKPLHILMAVVAIVLLIACANIATLLLARAAVRRPEFLARLALGAPRRRLVRQVLTESVLLSLLGGLVGAALAWWFVKLLDVLLRVSSVGVIKVGPNSLILAFTVAISLLTGILFGIIPASKFSRLDLRPGNAIPAASKKRVSGAQALIALQVSLSLVLLIGAGFLAHSLLALELQNIGFQRENVLLVETDAGLAGYQQQELLPLYRSLDERLSRLPGVLSATVARYPPESGTRSSWSLSIEGRTTAAAVERLEVYDDQVGPGFFETLKIPLLLGRAINNRDTPTSPAVAVVNQAFVNRYIRNGNPIGQHMAFGPPPGFEIVGVAADSKFYDLRDDAKPMAFVSIWQRPASAFELVVRTAADPQGVATEVRQAVTNVSSKLPILRVRTLDYQLEHSLEQQKMIATLCGIFGMLALALSSIGIYGTLAYSVTSKTSEIGIRMAIGAQSSRIIWMVLRDYVGSIFAGLAIGVPIALIASRSLKSFLYGVSKTDPLSIAGAILLILAVAFIASFIPASRAARIDPMRALRHE